MTGKLVLALLFLATICPPWAADGHISGRLTDTRGRPVSHAALCLRVASAAKTIKVTPLLAAAQGKTPVATSDKTSPPQLSGTVVDASGAVIGGATVQVRSANGTVQVTTQSDTNGSFIISGLATGNYQLVVSNPGFATKETPVTLGTTEAPASLRISLAVGSVSSAITVNGRADDLVGIAVSATQGTVGATEIQDRPILRAGEVMETMPGLIITQHAGGGKANQYFLRGFNLDHGTDFATFLDGMPLNLPSHAHGEGYSDMNTVIDELVQRVNFQKGPYYAEVGNYGSTGNADLVFFKTLPQTFFDFEGGMYGYARGVFGASQKLGLGNLLIGGEAYYDDGPWKHPDGYAKFNELVTYSRGGDAHGFSITARSYHGKWNSSDQIPDNAVPLVGFFGALNPADGGNSGRYSLQGEWHHASTNSETQITAYGFYYDLDLFSDFTYYLYDPIKGDQFEQHDTRWVGGLDARHTISSEWWGRRVENSFGLQLRSDWISNGLYRAENRMRVAKEDVLAPYAGEPNGYLPADTDVNKFTDTLGSFYGENKIQWTNKFRSVLALRGDEDKGVITSFSDPRNSGSVTKFLPSPKLSLVFGPWADTEIYAQGGFSFHSNDVRGATQNYEPISPDYPYPNTLTAKIPLLTQTKGAETGVRTVAIPHLQSTLSLWYLHSNSELEQDGDTGGTVPSEQSSNRCGVEWANYYTPGGHWAFDFDMADSRARFTTLDPADATFMTADGQLCAAISDCYGLVPIGGGNFEQGPGGKWVPEAVGLVISSGATLHDLKGFSASLRLRDFGPRYLTSDAVYRSKTTTLLNAEVGRRINNTFRVSVELLNLLNCRDHDIDYAYVSHVTPTATPAFTDVFHPVEPFQARVKIEITPHFRR